MDIHWFALQDELRRLPIGPGVESLDDLYTGLPVGVYSVFRTFAHNRFLELERHFDRMDQSMALLGWPERVNRPQFRAGIEAACTQAPWEDSRVRVDILSAPVSIQGVETRSFIALHPLAPPSVEMLTRGVAVDLAPGLARETPLAKTADFARKRKAYAATHRSHASERLLVSENGEILEGTSSNFYAVLEGELRTAGQGVLEGITRTILLSLAARLNLPVRFQAITTGDLPRISEAMISSSSRGLLPVTRVGELIIGDGVPGPVFQKLREAYEAYVRQAARPAGDVPVES